MPYDGGQFAGAVYLPCPGSVSTDEAADAYIRPNRSGNMAKSKSEGDTKVFSEQTLKCLRSAGWSPAREVPVEVFESAFAEDNLQLPSKVRFFLSHFGGLIISYKNLAQQDDTLDFLADEAVQGLGNHALRSYEEIIAAGRVCPIGHYAFGSCLLMMTAAGKVYGGQDVILYYLGESGPHAIENIITGRNGEAIHHTLTPSRDVEG